DAMDYGAPLDISAVIATGKYLFPFRTEKSSPLAPMVLGAQAPGRVGCRRFSGTRRAAARRPFGVARAQGAPGGARRRAIPRQVGEAGRRGRPRSGASRTCASPARCDRT